MGWRVGSAAGDSPRGRRFPRRFVTALRQVHIAYQVLGEGDVDLVFVMGWLTNLETYWELPGYRRFMAAARRFTRLILFDKRGMGLFDRREMAPSRSGWTMCGR